MYNGACDEYSGMSTERYGNCSRSWLQTSYLSELTFLHSLLPSEKYKVVQIWPGRFVCKQVTVCPGHIWTTLYFCLPALRICLTELLSMSYKWHNWGTLRIFSFIVLGLYLMQMNSSFKTCNFANIALWFVRMSLFLVDCLALNIKSLQSFETSGNIYLTT
jgi:hypothetical protein